MDWDRWKHHVGEHATATHRAALGTVLRAQKPLTIVEFGIGEKSTPWLLDYVAEFGGSYFGYENNRVYAADVVGALTPAQSEVANVQIVSNWDAALSMSPPTIDLAFIDHWPADHRAVSLKYMKDRALVLVAHDWQDEGCHWGDVAEHFRYTKVDDRVVPTTAILSNRIDVTAFELL